MNSIDFSRSFCYYVPQSVPIWVRMQVECRLELFDRAAGTADEYLLTVRTQTGLRTKPLSDKLDPGYDFWMIFSRHGIYVRRNHTSAHRNNPSLARLEEFVTTGWQLQPSPATPLNTGVEIREALRAWKPVVARSEFTSSDGTRGFAIDYPVKWADGNDDDSFRVETGPVLMLDPERVRPEEPLAFDDFQWAYLDYHSFDATRCFLECPTSILTGATHAGGKISARRDPPLTDEQVAMIEARLYAGWEPPIPPEALQRLFQTDHFSAMVELPMQTRLFALD